MKTIPIISCGTFISSLDDERLFTEAILMIWPEIDRLLQNYSLCTPSGALALKFEMNQTI
ncbi:hypothetical protein BLOT_007247 [Blomia tropicalis]|nr:hypothetical protein BLOT_007247 [Blomia tropicalis]